jgi:hypothetical protein
VRLRHLRQAGSRVAPLPHVLSRALGLVLGLAGLAGCGGAIRVAPHDIPNVAPGRLVATTDGGGEVIPDRIEGTLVLREDAGRLMVRPEDDAPQAVWVPDGARPWAEAAGWAELEQVEVAGSVEAGVAAPGTARSSPLGRVGGPSAAPATPPPPGSVLWIRDQRGRLVEVPLAAVDHLDLESTQPLSSTTKVLLIAGGIVAVGAVAAIAVATAPPPRAHSSGNFGQLR